jgi:hypothetical protein
MSNPVRNCVVCGQRDDHPRCQTVFPDGSSAYHHHDCGALLEPPCPSCWWLVQHKGNLVGEEWRQQVLDLHEQITADQLDLQPQDRDPVEAFLNGEVK